jgi:hypothetical protein
MPIKIMSMEESEQQDLWKQGEELHRLIEQKTLTLVPLDTDYNLAGKYWRSDMQNRQFWSRVVVRCLCADIEARLFIFRRIALEAANISKVSFTKEERETLVEMREVVENGNVRTKPKWLPIDDSIKESFRLFAKAMRASFTLDCNAKGFRSLCDTFIVRNRLMHPKDVVALEVHDKDVQTAEEGIHWLNQQCENLFVQCHREAEARIIQELEILQKKSH